MTTNVCGRKREQRAIFNFRIGIGHGNGVRATDLW